MKMSFLFSFSLKLTQLLSAAKIHIQVFKICNLVKMGKRVLDFSQWIMVNGRQLGPFLAIKSGSQRKSCFLLVAASFFLGAASME